jgi:hypothetical protein
LIATLVDFVIQVNLFPLGRNRCRAMAGTTEKRSQLLDMESPCSSMVAIGPSSPLCKFPGLRADAEPVGMRRDDRRWKLLRKADFPDHGWPIVIFAIVLFGWLAYKTVYELDIVPQRN